MNDESKKTVGEFLLKEREQRTQLLNSIRSPGRSNLLGALFGLSIFVLAVIGRTYFRNDIGMRLLLLVIPFVVLAGISARRANDRLGSLVKLLEKDGLLSDKNKGSGHE